MTKSQNEKSPSQINLKDFIDEKEFNTPSFISENVTKDNPIFIGHDDAMGDAVGAEYFILNKIFGSQNLRWQMTSQKLLRYKGKQMDCLKIFVKETNSEEEIFFDISEFFSK